MNPDEPEALYEFAEELVAAPRPVPVVKVVAYRSPQTFSKPAPAGNSLVRDVQIPLYLVGGAVALELIAGLLSHQSVADTGVMLFLHLLFYGTFSSIAIWVAALRRGTNLGPAAWVPVKLVAFAVVPTAVLDFAAPVLRWVPFGPLIALGVMCYTLLGVLFDLDESDSWFYLWIVVVTNIIGIFLALKLV